MQFKVNVGGQNYIINAHDEESIPDIVEQISNEQEFQQKRSVSNIPQAKAQDFIGEIRNQPSVGEKIRTSLPVAGQFAGGITGGAIGARFGRPNFGGAVGGTIGRGIGEIAKSLIRQAQQDPAQTAKNVISSGPFNLFSAAIKGMPESERKRIMGDMFKTGAIETAAGAFGHGLTKFGTTIAKAVGNALLGDRVVERGVDKGFKELLDPDLYQNRFSKKLAIKTNKFFRKLKNVTGRKTQVAMNKNGVGDRLAPIQSIKSSISDLDRTLGNIDDFGVDVSNAQRKMILELRDEIMSLDDNTTMQELWDFRKRLDRVVYNKRFVGEAKEYIDGMRKVVASPIRNASPEVAESFNRYHFVTQQEDELGKQLSAFTLGDPESTGEIFAPKTEQYASNLLKSTKDEQIRVLKQLDSFLDNADDRVVDDLLNVSAAEMLDKGNVGVTLAGRIGARLFGGRRGVARVGQFIQSPGARVIKRGIGRVIPLSLSEAYKSQRQPTPLVP